MNARSLLAFLAAILVTGGQTLIFAVDTMSAPEAAPSVATAARLISGLLGA